MRTFARPAAGHPHRHLLFALLACSVLALVLAASQATNAGAQTSGGSVVFDGSPGDALPPSTLGPYMMTPFANNPYSSSRESVDAPGGGMITFDRWLERTPVPFTNGYSGDVFCTAPYFCSDGPPDSLTITLPPNTAAFYLYVAPNYTDADITVTANGVASSGPIAFSQADAWADSVDARYVGFYAVGGAELTQITITQDEGGQQYGFLIGEFGIARYASVANVTATASFDDTAPTGVVPVSVTVTDPNGNPVDGGFVTIANDGTTLCMAPVDNGRANCTVAAGPATSDHAITAMFSGAGDLLGKTTTDTVSHLAKPTIVSASTVLSNDGPAWLIQGGGFSGATSVTVCDVAVPFTIVNDNTLLVALPAVDGPEQCTIAVTAAGGTGSSAGAITVVPKPQPGAPVVVFRTGNAATGTSTPTPTPTEGASTPTPTPTPTATPAAGACDSATTVTLSGQWTLVAWPGDDGVSVADALSQCEDISSQVSVIWGFDATTQAYQAYFPSATDVPGANDLATLTQGLGYWVGLTDPSAGDVSWKVVAAG